MMRKYDDEFKRQILKKVFDGQSVSAVSREIGVAESLIHKWKRQALSNGANGSSGTELKEIAELKKRSRELEMEVEILNDSLRESSAEEVKRLCFYRQGKSPLSVKTAVPCDAGQPERVLCAAEKVKPTAEFENKAARGFNQGLLLGESPPLRDAAH